MIISLQASATASVRIASIEAIDNLEPGYCVQRGWNEMAQIHATSVIDAVAVNMTIIGGDRRKLVSIGGIAHAGGTRDIEGRSAGGPRSESRRSCARHCRNLTWVISKCDWPFQQAITLSRSVVTTGLAHRRS